jgi:beta-aspartyl-peptidase (threonine type)
MKKISTIILLALLCSLVVFAQTKDEKAKAEIRKVMDAQATAWNRGSIEGFMQGYWNSPQLTFVSGANVTRGWQPTVERYKKSYDTPEKMGVLTFSELEITILSKDAAVVLGNWALQREKDKPGGKFTLVFRRFKDGWKIVHDHTS